MINRSDKSGVSSAGSQAERIMKITLTGRSTSSFYFEIAMPTKESAVP